LGPQPEPFPALGTSSAFNFDATRGLVGLVVGAAVPADCIINDGEIEVDESAMTGESLPWESVRGKMAKMGGTIAQRQLLCSQARKLSLERLSGAVLPESLIEKICSVSLRYIFILIIIIVPLVPP
jgi:P-type E1-E2 ATPase